MGSKEDDKIFDMERTIAKKEHTISSLPVLVLMPHSLCDCKCLMCDIWKDLVSHEISLSQLSSHLADLKELKVQWVVFSGGEPLLHSNLFVLCDLLREAGIRVTLLSTGQLLKRFASEVASRTDDTILSLDGPEPVHDAIRRVKGAHARMCEGIGAARKIREDYRFSCRTTVQRQNFRFLRQTLKTAREMGFDSISYLAADVSSTAFNRPRGWNEARRNQVALAKEEIPDLENEIESLIYEYGNEIETRFIRESPEKLRRIVHHFRAQIGETVAVSPQCNAPWVSAVIEADGTVRPCFFHRSLGNINEQPFMEILNGPNAIKFRETLDVSSHATCQRCVCSLHLENGMISEELNLQTRRERLTN